MNRPVMVFVVDKVDCLWASFGNEGWGLSAQPLAVGWLAPLGQVSPHPHSVCVHVVFGTGGLAELVAYVEVSWLMLWWL